MFVGTKFDLEDKILMVFFNKVFHAIFAATIVVMVLKTRHRSYEWMTEERLFTSGLKVCPNNAKVRNCIFCILSISTTRLDPCAEDKPRLVGCVVFKFWPFFS